MEQGKLYRFEDLKRMIVESSEFNALKGQGIDNVNRQEQEKEVKTAVDKSKKLSAERKFQKPEIKNHPTDFNKTMIDGLEFAEEPSDEWKDRVEAQVQGYDSAEHKKDAKNKDYDPSLEFSGDRFYKSRKEIEAMRNDVIAKRRHAGLKAREEFTEPECRPHSAFKNEKSKMKNESLKRLHFKNTVFLSEDQALSHVPDDFKHKDGRFFMRDANGTDFLVECRIDDKFGFASLRVVSSMNKVKINEQLEKMRHLFNYDRKYDNVRTDFQKDNVNEMIGRVKFLSENEEAVKNDTYTMEQWEKDGTFNAREGQYVDFDVFSELRDCVPPKTYGNGYFQVGEATRTNHQTGQQLFATFKKDEFGWKYIGCKPEIE